MLSAGPGAVASVIWSGLSLSHTEFCSLSPCRFQLLCSIVESVMRRGVLKRWELESGSLKGVRGARGDGTVAHSACLSRVVGLWVR